MVETVAVIGVAASRPLSIHSAPRRILLSTRRFLYSLSRRPSAPTRPWVGSYLWVWAGSAATCGWRGITLPVIAVLTAQQALSLAQQAMTTAQQAMTTGQ
jgi:hypothetical protein